MRKVRDAVKKHAQSRLITIVCLQEGDGFVLQYYFDAKGRVARFEVRVPQKDPVVESVAGIYPAAGVFEREIHDLFGVEFFGNPRLHEKLLLPDGWEGKPPMVR